MGSALEVTKWQWFFSKVEYAKENIQNLEHFNNSKKLLIPNISRSVKDGSKETTTLIIAHGIFESQAK